MSALLILALVGAAVADYKDDDDKLHSQANLMRLKSDLFNRSPMYPGPTKDDPLTVTLGFTLQDIVKADSSTNEVDLVYYEQQRWKLNSLMWDPNEYGNITDFRTSAADIWTPDITAYSSTRPVQVLSPQIAVVTHDGSVMFIPAQRLSFMCDPTGVDSEEGATCAVKFGSWVYSGFEIDLKTDTDQVDLSSYYASSKYEILSATQTRQVQHYSCCPEPYIDVNLVVKFRERR
uniref:Soluble acetylcholine receptor n=4 Tax=Aplysia californica TaxID=6500 RepID=UPI0003B7E06E|nr:Chain A, Soluble acetylcholine receptor [Aplysia californica]4FRR_B Chain B, Soluble acetylcholine receptor [Aplysia californica]4FRR_C Chain C, Soluble acetylcholine receptor [Aplysia californica]4FRR_D Chain D, Soluble acetylcholine receptor [Aplysia californica]4FRR_E Chain E, Soluble acetylcholine receptor [Aplysia californica]4FRR_F Chain F, Soluble acetylcholine receptor [Aplysia californica]4FRR_G Chain G, Soluble acetylcholine receptor [Aplysia californica]4FRR_H Chain H, Soluble 